MHKYRGFVALATSVAFAVAVSSPVTDVWVHFSAMSCTMIGIWWNAR